MIKRLAMLAMGFVLTPAFHAQVTSPRVDSTKLFSYDKPIELTALGLTKIFLKDGSIKVNCTIFEIRANSVVYKKDRTLHDLAIDKIKRIDSEKEMISIYFDDKQKSQVKPLSN